MNDKDFSQKAFEDAINATIYSGKAKPTDEETDAFQEKVANDSDHIMDAAKLKAELIDHVDVDQLAKVVVLTGCKDAFVALTGTLMMICFHVGWKACMERKTEGER